MYENKESYDLKVGSNTFLTHNNTTMHVLRYRKNHNLILTVESE